MKHKYALYALFIIFLPVILAVVFFLKQSQPRMPDIYLITIDALRPDHLGCYGYERKTSPNIDEIAKQGVLFLNCFSTAPATSYSFVAYLTGRYLGIANDSDYSDTNILDKSFTTLAEYLKANGYYTVAFVHNAQLMFARGFEQGFDHYVMYGYKDGGYADEMTTDALDLIRKYQVKRPIFFWIHYIDVHAPYLQHEEYFKGFSNDRLYKSNDKILQVNTQNDAGPAISRGYIPKYVFSNDMHSLNYYIACYDSEISYTDFHLGRLLKAVDNNSMVIISADHGESFGEHNVFCDHGENIYDSVLRIPLIIKDNRYFRGGKKVPTAVSSVDIVPSILQSINPIHYSFSRDKFDGTDLGLVVKNKELKRKYIYSYWPWSYSIRDIKNNRKYILNGDGTEELYFLPDEEMDHAKDGSFEAGIIKDGLKSGLTSWLDEYPVRADINRKKTSLSKQEKENLRSLGYLR